MKIKILDGSFAVGKVEDYSQVNLDDEFIFIGKTDEENSLVCEEGLLPNNTIEVEKGWKAMVITGILDFSLVGIIAKISNILTEKNISIFVISTFNTDYILVKEDSFNDAISELERNGYEIQR